MPYNSDNSPSCRDLLRFTTLGSVDDGKSTLIGRLLYDSKSLLNDQYEALLRAAKRKGEHVPDFAMLTDGLKAEREQGITIDVAHRFFATHKRKFIIVDTPGHVQYTRNMVTGASGAQLALLLVDARKGVLEQTRRHAYIAWLLGIRKMVICVNKMDLVDFEEQVFNSVLQSFKDFAKDFQGVDLRFIPISALHGDNVVEKSRKMTWYHGPALLPLLEEIETDERFFPYGRFPVQYVIRANTADIPDFRAFAGSIAGGFFQNGDKVLLLPSGLQSQIACIHGLNEIPLIAFAPMAVSIELTEHADVARGDMIVHPEHLPRITSEFEAMLCWMNNKGLNLTTRYVLRHTSREVKCFVKEVIFKVDFSAPDNTINESYVGVNDVARVRIQATQELFLDSYSDNRQTGSLILIDESSNETVGALMVI